MSELKLLIKTRQYVRQLVTNNYKKKDSFLSLSFDEKEKLKTSFEDYNAQLKDLNPRIQALKWSADESESAFIDEMERCEEYSSKIRESLSVLSKVLTSVTNSSESAARSLLKSPTAPLPTFNSTDGEDLTRFFNEFEETVSKYPYPDYDKLLLLKQQIKGRALVLINSLEADKQGYSHAKKLLLCALASPETQIFNTIKKLTEIKLTNGSDPFDYISKMRLITESVKKLKINSDNFLQYFFWSGLNESFRNQLIQITNHSKPSLPEILDNFFEACERYQALQAQGKDKRPSHKSSVHDSHEDSKSSTNLAAKVDYKPGKTFKPCSLCTNAEGKEATHPLYKCLQYDSNLKKVNKIKELNGCIKCGNLNHATNSCRYRFNLRCQNCSDWHFGFLCEKSASQLKSIKSAERKATSDNNKNYDPKVKSPPEPKKKSKETSGNIIITEVLKTDLDKESILPTFTCEVKNGSKIRCLKDGGCQSNLISEDLASALNLKVLKDKVDITINGINIPQQYCTKLVEVHLKFGSQFHLIQALCIPSIKIHLKLPQLYKVVKGFMTKDYKLADEKLSVLSKDISKIDFIMGTNAGYCIPETEILFGPNKKSIFSQTPFGVLLKGDINQLIEDLDYLPQNQREYCSSQLTCIPYPGFENQMSCLTSSTNSIIERTNFSPVVLDEDILTESFLTKASRDVLESNSIYYTNTDDNHYEEDIDSLNEKLVRYALENTSRDKEGRLVMPLLWNSKISHLLGKNRNLSSIILKSNLKTLIKTNRLEVVDNVFKEQEEAGIIERIEDLENFLRDHPEHSFLSHMPVFRMDRETTKCRVVFLSNLCEKDPSKALTVSHNQAIHSGPSLNQKLASALIHLRFDSRLLCFDISKAFNNIVIPEVDQNRQLFLWFRNVDKGDHSIIAYRNIRLSFGLRCSPTLLLLGLYKILIIDSSGDNDSLQNLKRQIYALTYMDNCAVSSNDAEWLRWAYDQLKSIFDPYKFNLQQFITNDESLQKYIEDTSGDAVSEKVKLLGLQWDRKLDTLSTKNIALDPQASTKRSILSTIAAQFDLYNFNGPLLNRSRLFMHDLQINKELKWDDKLSSSLLRQWRNIAKQANSSPVIEVPRFVGQRDGKYSLLAFADSSRAMYGVVIFIKDTNSNKLSFLLAKNRIVNKQLDSKSIPSLEMQGISLAAECLVDTYKELSGESCINPISIVDMTIYSDSLVALSWLKSSSNDMAKMQKRSIFVMNRIHHIQKLCEKNPINFSFISGFNNPADAITRCLSYKQLLKTNYLNGPTHSPNTLEVACREDILFFRVPPLFASEEIHFSETSAYKVKLENAADESGYIGLIARCSSFRKVVMSYKIILSFINMLKRKVMEKRQAQFGDLSVKNDNHDYFAEAVTVVIRKQQQLSFPEVFNYFSNKDKKLKDMPNLVGQLNLYIDKLGLLRVRSKIDKPRNEFHAFPLLLPKESKLTNLIIMDLHLKLSHAGCYSLLAELRKQFWIPHYFSVVKRIVKACVGCRRFRERGIKLNQSVYREFRVDPPNIPYRYIFMDYMGPFSVKENGKKGKVWILCVTCMYTRAINLKICSDLSTREFLRSFQLHTFEFGLPQYAISDMGSQLLAGSNIISDFLKDPETKLYLSENGVKDITFEQFYKGHSQLGGMVESCVKLVKRIIYGSIRNNILSSKDFQFLICETVHLVNRRPIAFKEALRDSELEVPDPITPENLIHGYDLPSCNIIPDLQHVPEADWLPNKNPQDHVKDVYKKLTTVRNNLKDIYNEEFLATLVNQAIDRKSRYTPINHKTIKKGDIVLIKEPLLKPSCYPMGIVKEVTLNANDEVTGAVVKKGKTGEITKRHSSSLIPLLTTTEDRGTTSEVSLKDPEVPNTTKKKRKAAVLAEERNRRILSCE